MKTLSYKDGYTLDFNKETYQGSIYNNERKLASWVFYMPDFKDVYFSNITEISIRAGEFFRQEIIKEYKKKE